MSGNRRIIRRALRCLQNLAEMFDRWENEVVVTCGCLAKQAIANRRRKRYHSVVMEEGRKRTLAIVAGVIMARHLKTADDLFDSDGPRTDRMASASVQWAEKIMNKIDKFYGK